MLYCNVTKKYIRHFDILFVNTTDPLNLFLKSPIQYYFSLAVCYSLSFRSYDCFHLTFLVYNLLVFHIIHQIDGILSQK